MPRKLLLTLWLASVFVPAAAVAEKLEITPFFGYRFGGEFQDTFRTGGFEDDLEVKESESYGLIVDIDIGAGWQVELLYSHQASELRLKDGFLGGGTFLTDIDVDYYHGGMGYVWAPGQVHSYLVGTLGATRFRPTSADFSSETRFSFAFGGGVKLFFSDHVGLRFDGRFFSTYIESNDDFICDPFGCYRFPNSTYMWQLETAVGLVFKF